MANNEKQHITGEHLGKSSYEINDHEEHKVSAEERAHAEEKKQAIIEHARHEVTVESSDKLKVLEKIDRLGAEKDDDFHHYGVGGDLKKSTFRKEIKHIQRKLRPSDRVGSKIIHQKVVSSTSNISSKTLTRPSGLLGGGIVAFLGTSVYLLIAKHIGIKYNYSVFLVLLVLGFVVGLILEGLIRLVRQKNTSRL